MIKSFFRNKKVIIYSLVIIILSIFMTLAFNILHYFNYIYTEEINDKNYRILIIEDSKNVDLDKIGKINNVKETFYFYDMLNIEVDKYENVDKVKQELSDIGYISKQAGEDTIKQLIEETNSIKIIMITSIGIMIILVISVLSLFISLIINDYKKDMALLKCIGYTKAKRLKISILRISILIVISTIIGLILSKFCNTYMQTTLNLIFEGIYPFCNIIYDITYKDVISKYYPIAPVLINLGIGIVLLLFLNKKVEYKYLND